MNSLRVGLLVVVGLVLSISAERVQAQYYGAGSYPGTNIAYGPPVPMTGFYPGGYYPGPYGAYPGYMNGFGYNPGGYGFWGIGPNSANYGGMGYGGLAMSATGVGGNGWYSYPFSGIRPYAVDYVVRAQPQPQPQPANVVANPPAANLPVVHTGAEIKLAYPKTATSSLTYSLNGTTYTIQPGYSQEFRDDRTWKLEFHRGGDGTEIVRYTLKPGTYRFSVGAGGWELRQVVKVDTGDLPPAPQPSPSDPPGTSTSSARFPAT